MEIEHCQRKGATEMFEPKNYGIKTTPQWEWEIVKGQRECPPAQENACKQVKQIRRVPKIEDLLSLSVAKDANLIAAEVIAIVLYSGPMVRGSRRFASRVIWLGVSSLRRPLVFVSFAVRRLQHNSPSIS